MIVPPFLFNVTTWGDWERSLDDHGWNIAAIIIVIALSYLLFTRLVGRVLRAALATATQLGADDPDALKARADTLISTITGVFSVFITFIGVTLVLDEIGVGVSALVAGVGLAGLAIGLGAQALIKDVINGVFILIEDQYRVDDWVSVAGTEGAVVEITPRRTVLRDSDGHVHSIPNGQIGVATNMTRGYNAINFDVTVAYEEDIERVIAVLDGVCSQLADDYAQDIKSPPSVLRISDIGADGVTLTIRGNVGAGKQWGLTGELRRRVKTAFDAEKVELPYRREVQIPWAEITSRRDRGGSGAEGGRD